MNNHEHVSENAGRVKEEERVDYATTEQAYDNLENIVKWY